MARTDKKFFNDLKESLEDALAFERGAKINLRVTKLPPKPPAFRPREIRAIRLQLNATQIVFASFLNVHVNTLRSWEQGSRRPRAADLKLLAIAKSNPSALL
jgi:putative transcriptional regulator